MGTGFITATVPTYVCEVSKAEKRGTMVATQLSIMIFGICLAYWTDYGAVATLDPNSEFVWRFPVAFQSVFAIGCATMIWALQESPRWLYAHGKHAQATRVFAQLYDTPEESAEVAESIGELREAMKMEQKASTGEGFQWKAIFVDKSDVKTTRRIMLAFAVGCWQELLGSSVLSYFATILFEKNLNFSLNKSLLLAGLLNIAYFFGALPPIFTYDRFGRKSVLIYGSALMTLA